jgi:hypothetical protein
MKKELHMNKKIAFLATLVVVVLGLSGASIAGSSFSTDNSGQVAPRRALTDISQLSAFSRSSDFSPSERASLAQLRTQTSDYPTDIAAGRILISSARPFVIPGEAGFVWIVKTSDGGICEFMPQLAPGNAPGFSSGCSSLDDFNRAGLAALNHGSKENFVAVVIQPSDVAAPVVTSPDGGAKTLPVQSNVTVASLRTGQAVTSGGSVFATEDLAGEAPKPAQ